MTVDRAGYLSAVTPSRPAYTVVPHEPTSAPADASTWHADRTDPSLAEHRARYPASHPLNNEARYVVDGRIAGVPVRTGADVIPTNGRIEVGGSVIEGGVQIHPSFGVPNTWTVDQLMAQDPGDFSVRDHPEGITQHDDVDGRDRIVLHGWVRAPESPSKFLQIHALTFAQSGEGVEAATRRLREQVAGVFPEGALMDPMQLGLHGIDLLHTRSFGGNAPNGSGKLENLTPELRVPATGEVATQVAGTFAGLRVELSPSHTMTLTEVPKTNQPRRLWKQRQSMPEPVPWAAGPDVIPTAAGRLQITRSPEGHTSAYWSGFLATEPRRAVGFQALLSREEAAQPAEVLGQHIEAIVRRVLPHEHLLAGTATQL